MKIEIETNKEKRQIIHIVCSCGKCAILNLDKIKEAIDKSEL